MIVKTVIIALMLIIKTLSKQVYHCKFNTPGFEEYNERLQVFVKFYIDGASYIEHTDFWDYFILYRKEKVYSSIVAKNLIFFLIDFQAGTYTICGFCTIYNFYLNFEKRRTRISQFIILPPFQRKGHGSALLDVRKLLF